METFSFLQRLLTPLGIGASLSDDDSNEVLIAQGLVGIWLPMLI